jgi:L-threonylcarbamoyladenylate synthase
MRNFNEYCSQNFYYMSIISTNIQQAAAILKNNELVAIPTETVYGLAANIYSEDAVKKIFVLKQRPLFNPLIVHIHHLDQLNELVEVVPPMAMQLAAAFWPGGLTMVLKKQPAVPGIITAGKETVAVRMPNHPVTLQLLKATGFPLAAPSANPFGSISPTTAKHVANYFPQDLNMVLDGGECSSGIESTIIGFENNNPVVYRLGAISIEAIEKVTGPLPIKNNKEEAPDAPGMLSRHYAPRTSTYLQNDPADFIKAFPEKKIGIISFKQPVTGNNVVAQEILSPDGNMEEAASRLYAALHRMDELALDMIVTEALPNEGLGRSINDRLLRATKNS